MSSASQDENIEKGKFPRSYRSLTGAVTELPAGDCSGFQSSLERDLLKLLDFFRFRNKVGAVPAWAPESCRCCSVVAFEDHPRISWIGSDNRAESYRVDAFARFNGESFLRRCSTKQPWFIETKYTAELTTDLGDLLPKFKAATREARKKECFFHLLTEREIRTALLRNVGFLRPQLRIAFDEVISAELIRILKRKGHASPLDLARAITPQNACSSKFLPHVWKLVGAGRILTNLYVPLSNNSRLFVSQEEAQG